MQPTSQGVSMTFETGLVGMLKPTLVEAIISKGFCFEKLSICAFYAKRVQCEPDVMWSGFDGLFWLTCII